MDGSHTDSTSGSSLDRGGSERPNHYRRTIKGQEIQVFDIEAAWGLNDYHNLASAVEYILRAPHKGSMKADVKKAIVHLQNFLTLIPDRGS